MIYALIVFAVFTLASISLLFLYKFGIKIVVGILVVILTVSTSGLCLAKSQMHKPFSIDIVEYLVKINNDGSMTTTKTVTKTIIQDKQQKEEK